MRFLCFLFLLIFAGIVGTFAYFNQQEVTLKFFDRALTAPIAAVAGGAYVLGMLSGWTIVGMDPQVRPLHHRAADCLRQSHRALTAC
ncbi:MAG TPA: hypothetical protein VG099_05475 [Gemmataceae bacterium]|jgi:predicted ribosomally synthesized peptide with SipW-like signal peptide|nr:hypothetical protein [Gemmataceae bacterium]